jgi:hypothetical protein
MEELILLKKKFDAFIELLKTKDLKSMEIKELTQLLKEFRELVKEFSELFNISDIPAILKQRPYFLIHLEGVHPLIYAIEEKIETLNSEHQKK